MVWSIIIKIIIGIFLVLIHVLVILVDGGVVSILDVLDVVVSVLVIPSVAVNYFCTVIDVPIMALMPIWFEIIYDIEVLHKFYLSLIMFPLRHLVCN